MNTKGNNRKHCLSINTIWHLILFLLPCLQFVCVKAIWMGGVFFPGVSWLPWRLCWSVHEQYDKILQGWHLLSYASNPSTNRTAKITQSRDHFGPRLARWIFNTRQMLHKGIAVCTRFTQVNPVQITIALCRICLLLKIHLANLGPKRSRDWVISAVRLVLGLLA